jgi:UDP-N-acetylmuramoyl-tripeptide--D-alanyl-D-alanine ligase
LGDRRTRAQFAPDVAAAVALLNGELRPGDVVLVKASRAASLERVVSANADDEARSAAQHTAGGGGAA